MSEDKNKQTSDYESNVDVEGVLALPLEIAFIPLLGVLLLAIIFALFAPPDTTYDQIKLNNTKKEIAIARD